MPKAEADSAQQVNDRQQLEAAIAALEAQRSLVGDTVTDVALAPIRARLAGIREHEQSLRQVTVLFMDMVGSTELSRRLDPEDIHAVIDGALQRLTRIVDEHQGRVLQYAGDSLLAVFGAVQAREDDPERAVRCALAIVREAQQIGAEVRATSGQGEFDVRVGVHTGSVLLGGGLDDPSTIRGITVNIAARMEQTAPVGGVRISHEMQRHVRGRFDLTDEPPISVKGFAEPMRSHLVLRERRRSFVMLGRGIEGIATPMVGRESELAKLTDAFETVRDDGSLMLVTVTGDPGLGKSRLMCEFEHWLERGHAAAVRLHGRAQPYSNSVPYGLLRDLLVWQFDILDSDSQVVAQTKLAQGLAIGAASAHQAALVGRLIGFDYSANARMGAIEGDGRQIRDAAFHVMAQYLRSLHARGAVPLVLLLDDLHWADDGSLDFIQHVARACHDLPVLLLCLTRPALFERRPQWASGHDNHLRLDLARLSRRGSRELAEALLARLDAVPAALRELVTSSAEGNPYFVEELIGMLIDDGVIVVDGEHWQVVADRLLQVRVPSTLAGVLQARLDSLAPQELATLQHASVIGHVFWDEALQHMAPVASQTLDGLTRRDLARGRDTSSFDGTREYVFKHHLLHKVTYDSVLKRDKREQHGLTAQWLVERSGERASEYHGVIADHFERAGDVENAVLYLRKAAGDARRAFALEVALAYFDRALALMPDSPNRFDTLVTRAGLVVNMGKEQLWAHDLSELEVLADALDDDGRRATAASMRTRYVARSRNPVLAEASAIEALAYAERSGNVRAAIAAHRNWGWALTAAGEFERARQEAEQSLALARGSDNWSDETSAHRLLSAIAQECGLYDAARSHVLSALNIARGKDDRHYENLLICALAEVEIEMGHYALATQHLRSAVEAFRTMAWDESKKLVVAGVATAACLRGEFGEALEWINDLSDVDSECADLQLNARLLMLCGDAQSSIGVLDKAERCYGRSADTYRLLNQPVAAFDPQAGLARLALANGDWPAAEAHLSTAIEQIGLGWRTGRAIEPLRIMLTCYQVLAARSDPRADELLAIAHATMQQRADLLEGDDKTAYLGNVATNRAIIAAWAVRHPS